MRTRISLTIMAIALALAACSEQPEYSLEDGKQALAVRNYQDARIKLYSLLDSEKDQVEARRLLVDVMLATGDGYAAERYLDQLSPTDLGPIERLELEAHSEIMKGQPRQAIRELNQADDRQDWNGRTYEMLIWAHREARSLDRNVELFDEALARFPEHAGVNAMAARYYKTAGEWQLAEETTAAALASNPGHYEARLLAGELAIGNGDLAGSLVIYQGLAADFPEHAIPVTNVAGLQLDLGLVDEAEQTLEAGLSRHPDFALLNFQNARLLFEKGAYAECARVLELMNLQIERYMPALVLSAKANLKLGNRELAIGQLRRAARDKAFAEEASETLAEAGVEL